MTREWMTIKDVSDYLQVPESTINHLIKDKQIPNHSKLGVPRFFKLEIDAWMQSDLAINQEISKAGNQYHYRGKPILEYKLSASKVLGAKTAIKRLSGFIQKVCELFDEKPKTYFLRQDFSPLMNNYNDYLGLSCQLGLIDNIRSGRMTHYNLTEFAWQISNESGSESEREVIKKCILDIVKRGRETIPQQRHCIFLLWYYLKLKIEGIEVSEEYFNKGLELGKYPTIRYNYAKSLCDFLFDENLTEEKHYLLMWDKICG
jgi:predicted DNA-binding transcriptional regulator AlpA